MNISRYIIKVKSEPYCNSNNIFYSKLIIYKGIGQ